MALCVNNIASFQNGPKDLYLRDLITELGQTSNLAICVDAADPRSYTGTGQTINDRSGSANDFFMGTTGAVESGVDPVFNAGPTNNNGGGVADENTYWTIAAGNRIANVTNGAPASTNWLRNNGVASAVAAIYVPNTAFGCSYFSTGDVNSGTYRGGNVRLTNTGHALDIFVTDGTRDSRTAVATPTTNSWNIVGFSYDEATGTFIFTTNSTSETAASITVSATQAFTNQNFVAFANTGTTGTGRIACCAVWNRALTSSELLSFYTQLKARRFPSVP